MHRRARQPAARDALDFGEHLFVGAHGVVNAALRRRFQALFVRVDENGDGLVIDEQLGKDVPQFSRAEHGNVRTLGKVQLVDDVFRRRHDARKQRFRIRYRRGQGGEVGFLRHDKVAQVSFRVDARDLYVAAVVLVSRKAVFAFAAGGGVVQEHARVFFHLHAVLARFAHNAHGKPPRNKGIARLGRSAIGAQLGAGEKDVCHFHLCLRAAGKIVGSLFRGENLGRENFPNLHKTPFMRRGAAHICTGIIKQSGGFCKQIEVQKENLGHCAGLCRKILCNPKKNLKSGGF